MESPNIPSTTTTRFSFADSFLAPPVAPVPPSLNTEPLERPSLEPSAPQPELLTDSPVVALDSGPTALDTVPAVLATAAPKPPVYALDRAKPLDPDSFPNQPASDHSQIPATIANFQHLLWAYKVVVRYNVIKKKNQIAVRGHKGSFDNHDNVLLTQINSLAALNGFPTSQISNLLVAVADRNLYNPVADWILGVPWDGGDRLPSFYATLVETADFSKSLKETLMYRWILSPVAAALKPSVFVAVVP
jgi:hypothetical protein